MTNLLIGLAAGLLCALGGALKDSPHEGFRPLTFLRSIVIGAAWGLILAPLKDHPLVIFCCCGYAERVTVEGYKIVRCQRPGKFDLVNPAESSRFWGFRKLLKVVRW